MTGDATTIWIQAETHQRMKKLKSEEITFDELVNVAIEESGIEAEKLQTEL